MKRFVRVTLARYRSQMLMCSLIAAMLASPLVDDSRRLEGLLAILQLALLLAGATYLTGGRVVRWVVLPVASIWLVTRLLEAFGGGGRAYANVAPFAGLAFSCAVLWAILVPFASISKVTSSVISEAVVSYLVIVIAFSQLYWVMDHFAGERIQSDTSLRSERHIPVFQHDYIKRSWSRGVLFP